MDRKMAAGTYVGSNNEDQRVGEPSEKRKVVATNFRAT
jgi:hypothetical protein